MFQRGQDCPNAFRYEPIKRILLGKVMEYSDNIDALIQEMYGLLGLAKQVLSDRNLERRCAAGSAMGHDLERPQRCTLPRGHWDNSEIFVFHAAQGADESNEHGGSLESKRDVGAFTPRTMPWSKTPNLDQLLGMRP
eukprot:6639528-Pyramimonas_sp.AAC.1